MSLSVPDESTSILKPEQIKQKKVVSYVPRYPENISLYLPVTLTSASASAFGRKKQSSTFSTFETRWMVSVYGTTRVSLTLSGGATDAVVSYNIEIKSKRADSDQNDGDCEMLASGSAIVSVKRLKMTALTIEDLSLAEEPTSFDLNLEISILKVTRMVPIPYCSLDTDIHSAIANEEEFQDVTLLVGPEDSREEIKANKFMLMARSPVFAAMFKSKMKESETNTVTIPDISPEVCKEILSYIYTGRVNCNNLRSLPAVKGLFLAAEKYELLQLKAMCENRMTILLSSSSAAGILAFAHKFSEPDSKLKKEAIAYVSQSKKVCSVVMKSEGWKEVEELGSVLVTEVLGRIVVEDEDPPAKRPRIA